GSQRAAVVPVMDPEINFVPDIGYARVGSTRREAGQRASGLHRARSSIVALRLQEGVIGEESKAAPEAREKSKLLLIVRFPTPHPGRSAICLRAQLEARIVAVKSIVRSISDDGARSIENKIVNFLQEGSDREQPHRLEIVFGAEVKVV